MTVNIEKKILAVVVIVASCFVVVGGMILLKKNQVDSLESEVIAFENTPTTRAGSENTSVEETVVESEGEVKSKSKVKEIKWEDLYKLDYKTGKAPEELKRLHKTKVRMPGFIVPLSDDLSILKEFLLVPNAQACIHVPPPPPNLIVYVILDRAIPMDKVANPSWIEGTLLIETTTSEYGNASYKMNADSIKEYKF